VAAIELEDPARHVVEEIAVVVIATTVPGYSFRKRSSHATDSASRWFVGSSSSSMSGARGGGGRGRRAVARRPRSSRRPCRRWNPQCVHRELDGAVEIPAFAGVDPILQSRLLVEQLLHLLGRDRLAELRADVLEPREQCPNLGDAFLDVAADVLAGIELGLLREVADPEARGGNASPRKSRSTPAMMRSNVDLPAPLAPSTPIFAPWKNDSQIPGGSPAWAG